MFEFLRRRIRDAVNAPSPEDEKWTRTDCVPWDAAANNPVSNMRRRLCAAVNHEPRTYDGSYCMGYSYVCSRCRSWVGPWSKETLTAVVDRANQLGEEKGSAYIEYVSRRRNQRD